MLFERLFLFSMNEISKSVRSISAYLVSLCCRSLSPDSYWTPSPSSCCCCRRTERRRSKRGPRWTRSRLPRLRILWLRTRRWSCLYCTEEEGWLPGPRCQRTSRTGSLGAVGDAAAVAADAERGLEGRALEEKRKAKLER